MNLNIDSLVYLINFLRKDYFNEKEFKKLIKTKGMKAFLEHQRTTGEDINIRKELEGVIYNKDYEDKYGFYLAKRNLEELDKDINKIIEYEDYIIGKAMENVYKIVPKDMKINCSIFLFLGGNDGGFTLTRNKIYINYGKYINNMEEFIKILSHELYHSRKISLKNRLIFSIKTSFIKYGKFYGLLGKIIEEGLASLVQHGPILKTDDPVGTLKKRYLILIKGEFQLLNEILIDIKSGSNYHKKLKELNLYAIGYYIASTIYNAEGVFTLDNWTVDLSYDSIIKKYIEICESKNLSSGFNKDIEKLIINIKGLSLYDG